eukprot:CAMPEP_0116157434 /NCGR_PEP_ID=MMETSP0329-20121206/23342_1 /TAXON_ID=697910 /ORGANISM="Pseudo-nitzschia arenysensis, Strain B593" /LENGTH=253 /DNA_ID=CAMNT_0003654541 /DNA_START=148 /DNA_END=906 /DNA_ORIENTATION=-
MIEAYDYSGGSTRYKKFVEAAIEKASASDQASSNSKILSNLQPRDAFYENFYHDLFHATFRPSIGVEKALDSYFYDRKDSVSKSWLPVPLKRNNYAAVQFRASYPGEPWRERKNQTLLRETTVHAIECVKSRVSPNNTEISAVYFASDTALAVEAAQDSYREQNSKPVHVWTSLDLETYDEKGKKCQWHEDNKKSGRCGNRPGALEFRPSKPGLRLLRNFCGSFSHELLKLCRLWGRGVWEAWFSRELQALVR